MGKHTAVDAEEPDDSSKAIDRLAEAIENLSRPISGGCCHCHCHCVHPQPLPWYPVQPYVTWVNTTPIPPVTTINYLT